MSDGERDADDAEVRSAEAAEELASDAPSDDRNERSDGASAARHGDGGGASTASDEGAPPSSKEAETEGGETRAQDADIDNDESTGGDPADGDDSDASVTEELSEEPPRDGPTEDSAAQDGGGDEEEGIKILPSDPIILPAKSTQTRAEAIEEGEGGGGRPSGEENDAATSAHPAPDSDSSNSNEESAHVEKEVPTNEPPLCDEVASDVEKEPPQTSENADGGDDGAESATMERGGGESEAANAEGSGSGVEADDDGGSSSEDDDATETSSGAEGGSDDVRRSAEPPSESGGDDDDRTDEPEVDEPEKDDAQTDGAATEDSATEDSPQKKDGPPRDDGPKDEATKDDDGATAVAEEDGGDDPPRIKLVDYASKSAGAQVLESSPSLKGSSNLLTNDKDKYSIAPCEDRRHVVVGLSEDILVKQIKLSNYERYSSRVREFEVLASQEYPVPNEGDWNVIGRYEARSRSGEQTFDLEEPAWARYLKFRFLSHYGSEHYCTLSQIQVHGSTMLQGFHEQWIENEKKELEEKEQGEQQAAQEVGEEPATTESDDVGGMPQEAQPEGGDGSVGEDGEPAREEAVDTSQDSVENGDATNGNPSVDELANSKKSPDEQVKNPIDATGDDHENEVDNEEVQTNEDMEERVDVKAVNDSQKEVMVDATEKQGGHEEDAPENVKEIDDDGSESSPTTAADIGDGDEGSGRETKKETKELQAKYAEPHANEELEEEDSDEGSSQDPEAEAKESQDKVDESQSNYDALNEDSTISTDEVESSENMSDASREPDVQQRDQTDPSTSADGGAQIQNDSSITSVTGIVTDAIKSVKDAIRTTVGNVDKERKGGNGTKEDKVDNATSDEGVPGEAEGAHEGKEVQTNDAAKPEESSFEATAQTTNAATGTQPHPEDNSEANAPQNDAKPKAEYVPSKTDDANAATADSKPEKGASKPEKATSKLEKESAAKEEPRIKDDGKTKKGPKTPVDRDLPRRGAATAVGKDDNDNIELSAGELFSKLSRRFPHAPCMKELDFQAFKLRTLAANAGKSVGGAGDGGGAKKMEPVFHKITTEIKSVQATQGQYEQYLSALNACYESLFHDMAKEMDTMQVGADQRLARLERAVFLSEMQSRVPKLPSYDGARELFSTSFLFSRRVFRFEAAPAMPDGFKFLCAGAVMLFLLVARWFPRGERRAEQSTPGELDETETAGGDPPARAASPLQRGDDGPSGNKGERTNPPAISIVPELVRAKASLEEENAALSAALDEARGRLTATAEEYAGLQDRHATLQQEHAALRKRHSELELSTRANGAGRGGEMTHVIMSENGADGNVAAACSTPTPSVQSEPMSQGRHIIDSPLKNRFRKKKKKAKNK